MKQDGVTLIELLVVIGIIGILSIVLGFEFVGWMARYRVESQIKTMHADLMNARQRAIERNIQYVAQLSANSYLICEDSNGNNVCDAPAETTNSGISRALSKNGLRYPMDRVLDLGVPPNPPANTIVIDRRGTLPCTAAAATCTGTILLRNPETGNVYGAGDVDYDCIVLSAVKINVGKYNVVTLACDAK